jgi:hypothetical protein
MPDDATPRPRWSIAPYFIVDDVVATANFYRDPVTSAWAVATCTSSIKASELFRLYSNGVAQGEAAVNAATIPTTEFVTYADARTGIAVANPSLTAATITITALDTAGHSKESKALPSLAPNAHRAWRHILAEAGDLNLSTLVEILRPAVTKALVNAILHACGGELIPRGTSHRQEDLLLLRIESSDLRQGCGRRIYAVGDRKIF